MDAHIAKVAADNRKAARIHLAWTVEQTARHLGLMPYFVDENGDGPFIQEVSK